MNVVFINDNKLYVCLYQNLVKTHYHFFLSINEQVVIGETVSKFIEGSIKNFPVKSFYN